MNAIPQIPALALLSTHISLQDESPVFRISWNLESFKFYCSLEIEKKNSFELKSIIMKIKCCTNESIS